MINCLPAPSRKRHEPFNVNPEVGMRCRQAVTSLLRSAEKMKMYPLQLLVLAAVGCSVPAGKVVNPDGDVFKKETAFGKVGMTRTEFYLANPPTTGVDVSLAKWTGSVPFTYTFHHELHPIGSSRYIEVLYALRNEPEKGGDLANIRYSTSDHDLVFRLTEVREFGETESKMPYHKFMFGAYDQVFGVEAVIDPIPFLVPGANQPNAEQGADDQLPARDEPKAE